MIHRRRPASAGFLFYCAERARCISLICPCAAAESMFMSKLRILICLFAFGNVNASGI